MISFKKEKHSNVPFKCFLKNKNSENGEKCLDALLLSGED